MWNTIVAINSVLWCGALMYTIYAIANAILTQTWKPLVLSVIALIILSLTQMVFSAFDA